MMSKRRKVAVRTAFGIMLFLCWVAMLNQAFWKNGAWLLQFQLRSKFRVDVCHIKQCCALNKKTFVDEYELLATNAEKEADGNACSKAELNYFASETVTPQEGPKRKKKGKPSLRQTLSYTNKVLFGPLLETSVQKRRRIKAEEEEEEEETTTQTTRKRKRGKKKKIPPVTVEPLIRKPENAHFLGQFPGSEPRYVNKVQACKVEIQPLDPEMCGSLHPGTVNPKSKVLIIKKPSNNKLEFDPHLVNDHPNVQKLYVASWNKEKEGKVPSCTTEDTPDESSHADESDGLSRNILKNINACTSSENASMASSSAGVSSETLASSSSGLKGDTIASSSTETKREDGPETLDFKLSRESTLDLQGNTMAWSSSDLKDGDGLEIHDLQSNRKTSSLLYIDNSKFSSAPSVIDAEVLENFPLERNALPGAQHETPLNAGNTNDILTIGMFDSGYQRLPSVSKILEATMPEADRQVLERWKAKMIRELGEEGFEEYRKGLFDKGKLLHGCIHSELTGVSPGVENMPTVQGVWTSISHVLPSITNVSVLESRLVHPYLYYQGAVDCVATYKGIPVLIDWKTSTKPKLTLKSMFDNPLQVVAYLGALNYDSSYQLLHRVQSAMVVVAYDSGLPAHTHIIDKEKCQAYWRQWCVRLVQFWRQQQVKEST